MPVNIALPSKNSPRSKRFEAIIDSGATACQFQAAIGEAIGLDIKSGDKRETLGITGTAEVFIHEIALYIPGGSVITEAASSYELPLLGLLGIKGFFEHFRIVFDPTALRVELERIYQA